MSDDADSDARIDLAIRLATYIAKYPRGRHGLEHRVKNLSQVSDAEMERLLPEMEHWLDLMEWQAKRSKRS